MTSENCMQNSFKVHKELSLFGRYITNQSIEPLLKNLEGVSEIDVIGKSVNKLPIYSIKIGSGSKKILMWSQMHGNESTTTKAIFDILNTLKSEEFKSILKNCSLYIIPILNPDGALAYTRLNASEEDLNRDAQNLSQPESMVLQGAFKEFKPDFCLNLHGQRTIFSAGLKSNPATVSFLAPAQDKNCTITANRKRAMELIAVMNKELQQIIPNQIGIYDDAFNINCVGDTFQSYNIPTVLFEAGHIDQDYQREQVREYIYIALLTLLNYISENEVSGDKHLPYLNIPENGKQFYDIIVRNAVIIDNRKEREIDIAIQFEETLIDNKVHFLPKIAQINALEDFYGHREIDAGGEVLELEHKNSLTVGNEIVSMMINNKLFSLKPVINRK